MDAAVVRINCGSRIDWVDPSGQRWHADRMIDAEDAGAEQLGGHGDWRCVGGLSADREADLPLLPASHAGLLRTERYQMREYRVALSPGVYCCRLILAETHEALSSHDRRFSLDINGRSVSELVQPFAIAQGHGRAGVLEVDGVRVNGAELCLRFGEKANIYGIEILPSQSDAWRISRQALAAQRLPALPDVPGDRRVRMLFVGHSGTFYWAIPETVRRMVSLGKHGVCLDVQSLCRGGRGVQAFYEWPAVHETLSAQAWDFVVLQDSSWGPIETPDLFNAYMPRLVDLVRGAGAHPILYAYSGPLRHTPAQRQALQQCYHRLGDELSVPVMPCAHALNRAMAQDTNQNYHNPDGHHLGMMAGYLFASVWYRGLTGQSAADLPEASTLGGYVPVPHQKAPFLTSIADAVCAEHRIGDRPDTAILSNHIGQAKRSRHACAPSSS